MSTLTATRVTINLEGACLDQGCADLAFRFRKQLGVPKYSQGASILEMPDSLQAWRDEHRTARKRADRAARLGYVFAEINQALHNDDIHAINTSLATRQGRPMTDGYTTRRHHGPLPAYPCDRHRVHTYGVVKGELLVAYLTVYRCGDLHLVSMILGHADHLDAGIMYLLFQGAVQYHAGEGGFWFYNRHDSGRPNGLVFYKDRLGFKETDIEWQL